MGRGEIKIAPQVFVKVVDSEGNPVAGVPVQHWFEGFGLLFTNGTDKDGRASFYVRYNHKGKFVVSCEGRDSKLEEAIPYEMGGEEDAGCEFTLQLSDKMVQQLSK